jgi:uncharacterized protein (DUF924 family)
MTARMQTVVTYLEMGAPPEGQALPPPRDDLLIMRALRPSVSFYRWLYAAVGDPWLWTDRKKLDDAALAAVIQDPAVEVHVLYVGGVPAGYAELDARARPDIELAYFGLIPEFIGSGLGRYLVDWAARRAWALAPRRFWVHTQTLDHPRALATYEGAGFRAYRSETISVDDPRPDEILAFWFPPGFDRDQESGLQAIRRWFRGGADADVRARFAALTDLALEGGLAEWEAAPRSRLALVLVLDQFPRSLHRDTPRAFAGARRAERLVLQTLDAGEHLAMTPFEQLFLGVVLGHSEELALHDRGVALSESLVPLLPPALRSLGELSASQARAHRDEIVRFGRHPSRNVILGRETTAEERRYLETEGPAHLRPVRPPSA